MKRSDSEIEFAKLKIISDLNPHRVFVENVRVLFDITTTEAKELLEELVAKGYAEQMVRLDCPESSCSGRMICSHSINEEPPTNVKCSLCETEGNEEFWYETSKLKGSIFYKMKKIERTKPSDFVIHPWDSVIKRSEAETVAVNIMKILKRTGDVFPEELLTFEQYAEERKKDGAVHLGNEQMYFKDVIGFCRNADTAKLFSKSWADKYN